MTIFYHICHIGASLIYNLHFGTFGTIQTPNALHSGSLFTPNTNTYTRLYDTS